MNKDNTKENTKNNTKENNTGIENDNNDKELKFWFVKPPPRVRLFNSYINKLITLYEFEKISELSDYELNKLSDDELFNYVYNINA
jgi:hypothetical protein